MALDRTGDWEASLAALSKSMEQTGPNSADGFFVAMAHWHAARKRTPSNGSHVRQPVGGEVCYDRQVRRRLCGGSGRPPTPAPGLPVDKADDLGIGDAFVEVSGSDVRLPLPCRRERAPRRFDRAADDLDTIQLGGESISAGMTLPPTGHSTTAAIKRRARALIQRHAQEKQPAMAHLAAWTCVMAPHAV